MKRKLLFAIVAFFVFCRSASSIAQFWDTNGAAAGSGGTGTWDIGTTANWNDSTGSAAPATWTNGNDATFSGSATYTVTTAGATTITANSIKFGNISAGNNIITGPTA